MSVVEYPAALPCPQTSTVTPAERRMLSSPDRPREAAALSRDRREFERVTFPPFSAAQAAAFRTWWRSEVFYGALWFVATWPRPEGTARAVRKFIGKLRWDFVPGGFWRVSGMTEVRGRGEEPRIEPLPIFLLHLDGDAVDEMGATFSADTDASAVPPSYVTSATGFGQQASFPAVGNSLIRSIYPAAQLLVDATDWQFDAFVTCRTASGLARTVLDITATEGLNQKRLLWVNFADAGDAANVQLDVRVRTGLASETALSVVDLAASKVPAGERVHVRVIKTEAIVSAYLNGTLCLQRAGEIFTAVPADAVQVNVGAAMAGSGFGVFVYSAFMDGQIDEVRFCQELSDDGAFTVPQRPFTVPITEGL